MDKTIKAVVIYSGGMDSFTALHRAIAEHGAAQVIAFSLNYGQRHKKELVFAAKVCADLGIEHVIHDATALRDVLGGSALTSDLAVPEGHYADESMKQTVVPNRNMILLSIAAGLAVARGATEVWTGMHSGDHAIYPDCRPEFVEAMNGALGIANYTPVAIRAPFLYTSKAGILGDAFYMMQMEASAYADTWTCYKGGDLACGKCGSCVERLEAFAEHNETDPLQYEKA